MIKIKDGYSIYDYANILHGGFDNVVKLIQDNPFLVNMDCNLSNFATQELTFSISDYVNKAPQLSIQSKAPSSIATYSGVNGQSLYDLALQVHGGCDNVVKFLQDNHINSINDQNQPSSDFTFNSDDIGDAAIRNVAQKRRYVFATVTEDFTCLITEDEDYLITEDGYMIII